MQLSHNPHFEYNPFLQGYTGLGELSKFSRYRKIAWLGLLGIAFTVEQLHKFIFDPEEETPLIDFIASFFIPKYDLIRDAAEARSKISMMVLGLCAVGPAIQLILNRDIPYITLAGVGSAAALTAYHMLKIVGEHAQELVGSVT